MSTHSVTHKGAEYRIIAMPTGKKLAELHAEASAIIAAQVRSNRSDTARQVGFMMAALVAWYAPAGAVAVELPSVPVGNAPTMNVARRALKTICSDELNSVLLAVATVESAGGKTNSTHTEGTPWVLRD